MCFLSLKHFVCYSSPILYVVPYSFRRVVLHPFGMLTLTPFCVLFLTYSVCCPKPLSRVALHIWYVVPNPFACGSSPIRYVVPNSFQRVVLHLFDILSITPFTCCSSPGRYVVPNSFESCCSPPIWYVVPNPFGVLVFSGAIEFNWFFKVSQIGCNHIPRASSWLIRHSTAGLPQAASASAFLTISQLS